MPKSIPCHSRINIKHVPLRRCIVSGMKQPQTKMIRFSIDTHGVVVPDITQTLPGRGLWVTCDRSLIEKAFSSSVLSRRTKRSLRVDPTILPLIITALKQRCLALLGRIRRSGRLVMGFDGVSQTLRHNRVGQNGLPLALIHASNASSQSCLQLREQAAADISVIDTFSAACLGMALGRNLIDHAVAAHGRLTDALLNDVQRLIALDAPNHP